MISKNKKRFEISMDKKSYDLISKFSEVMHLTKSEFIESCCCAYIKEVVDYQLAQRKGEKKDVKNKKLKKVVS